MIVEVLLSTWNGERYVAEQLESLLTQDFPVRLRIRDEGRSVSRAGSGS